MFLSGCYGSAAVPGGDKEVNKALYQSRDQFLAKISQLHAGMHASIVLDVLGNSKDGLVLLSRAQVINELYGGNTMAIAQSFSDHNEYLSYVQRLSGYKLYFDASDKEHGFSSPIRLKTAKTGFRYVVTLIFEDDRLLEDPIVAGGKINESKSTTVFDVINPANILSSPF